MSTESAANPVYREAKDEKERVSKESGHHVGQKTADGAGDEKWALGQQAEPQREDGQTEQEAGGGQLVESWSPSTEAKNYASDERNVLTNHRAADGARGSVDEVSEVADIQSLHSFPPTTNTTPPPQPPAGVSTTSH